MRTDSGHHHHLFHFLGSPPACSDHLVARTLFGLSAMSLAITLLVVGFGGQYASEHVSADTAARWASGSVFDRAGEDGYRLVMGSASNEAPESHQNKKNKTR